MPNVLNFEREYLWARHPGVGFNKPNVSPPTRASTKEKKHFKAVISVSYDSRYESYDSIGWRYESYDTVRFYSINI
jgi:hypothetical protein